MQEVLIVLIIFGSFVAVIKIIADNRLRHKLVDKGMVDENIKYLYQADMDSRNLSSLKWGMVLIGIGLPLFILRLLPYHIADETILGAMFIVGGIGLILFYVMVIKISKKPAEASEN